MLCPKCNKDIPDNSKFCLECGSDVSGGSGTEGERTLGGLRTLAPSQPQVAEQTLDGLNTISPERGAAGGPQGRLIADRYEILEEIGRGGFAAVFKARDTRLGRMVAFKRLHAQRLIGPEAQATVERFRREAQAIATLNHRNIVQVYDHDHDGEGYFIVMEFIEGGSLRDHLKKTGKLPVADAIQLMRGICQGLSAAHRHNLVHRDIKPGNILLAQDGEELVPKIVDFGLARAGANSNVSLSGYGMGTPYYMPPEQRRDAKSVNHTADIYALGKTLYEMVTAEIPDNVDPEVIPPPPLLARVILKCIKSRPEERYFSVDEMTGELGMVLGRRAAPSGEDGTADNACPSCGKGNPKEVKFCVVCGAGLTRVCPECEREDSVHRKFCGGCGTDAEGFRQAQDALARMESFRKEKRWSRVTKEFSLLPEKPRFPGEKGQGLLQKILALVRESEAMIEARDKLKAEIEGTISTESFERALELVPEYQLLDPHNAEVNALPETLKQMADDRDYRRAQEKAGALEKSAQYAGAAQCIEEYLAKYGQGRSVADAHTMIERLQLAQDDHVWSEAMAKSDALEKAEDLQGALQAVKSYQASYPQGRHASEAAESYLRLLHEMDDAAFKEAAEASAALEHEESFEAAAERFQKYVEFWEHGRHVNEAHDAIQRLNDLGDDRDYRETAGKTATQEEKDEFESAIAKLEAYCKSRPAGRHLDESKAWVKRIRETLASVTEWAQKGEKALNQDGLEKAAECFRTALNLDNRRKDLRKKTEEVAQKIAQWAQQRAQAQMAFDSGRYAEARRVWQVAAAMRTSDSDSLARADEARKQQLAVLVKAAEQFEQNKQFIEAHEVWSQAVTWTLPSDKEILDRHHASEQLVAKVTLLLGEAKQHINDGRYRKGLASAMAALEIEPGHKKALALRATAEEAIERVRKRRRRAAIGAIILTSLTILYLALAAGNAWQRRRYCSTITANGRGENYRDAVAATSRYLRLYRSPFALFDRSRFHEVSDGLRATARTAFERQDYDSSLAILDQLFGTSSLDEEAQHLRQVSQTTLVEIGQFNSRGQEYLSNRMPKEAADAFQQTLNRQAWNSTAKNGLASAKEKLNFAKSLWTAAQTAVAAQEYQRALETVKQLEQVVVLDSAAQQLQAKATQNIDDIHRLLVEGNVALASHKATAAMGCFSDCLALQHQNADAKVGHGKAAAEQNLSQTALAQAQEKFKASDYKTAREACKQALEHDVDSKAAEELWMRCEIRMPPDGFVVLLGGQFPRGLTPSLAAILHETCSDLPMEDYSSELNSNLSDEVSPCHFAATEVTVKQYCEFLNQTKSIIISDSDQLVSGPDHAPWLRVGKGAGIAVAQGLFSPLEGCDNRPVASISWYGATAYCNWLVGRLGGEVSLPTQAQWEMAASWDVQRSAKLLWPWGNTPTTKGVCLASRGPIAVGTSESDVSPVGAHDMAGNVAEWCSDIVTLGSGRGAVVKGGFFSDQPEDARVTVSTEYPLDSRRPSVGFRVVHYPRISNGTGK